ncbi:hypothetical protein QYM36_009765 [Artemia franciscana]|uniref:Major facilitator superfamily (MFS) profile domain-containing protein n=1 Tax=Artemia franciscana TaxID=6661 RepID=A0AA88LA89_ARTSF|nr:hypothetical protein QYM36_009765 [Artemia franciscana]
MGFKERCQDLVPARYVMAFMAFLGYINVFLVRNNINLAIVAMVNYTAIRGDGGGLANSSNPGEGQCGSQSPNSTATNDEDGPFAWTEPIQALISTSFLWGYVLTNIPGGRLADVIGTKYLFAACQVLVSILTLLIPVAAYGGWEVVIVIRVLMGFCQGPSLPCMHPLLAKWAPPEERSTLSAIIYAGSQPGTVLSLILSGLIVDSLGWEAVFYIEGCVGFVWAALWLMLVYDSPDQHPRISEKERDFINKSIAKEAQISKKSASVPWKSIFTSLPFYAILFCNIGHNWGFLILLTELPIYMKNIFGFDIKSNSLITSFPYLLSWFASLAASPLADLCKRKGWMKTIWVRKVFTMFGHFGPALTLVVVAFSGCNLALVIAMLALGQSLQAAVYGGWFINHIDLAPNYSGLLFGITNGLGIIPSWFGPPLVGVIVQDNQTIEAWRLVFLMAAVVLGADAIFFLFFGSATEQPWNKIPEEDSEIRNINEPQEKGIINESMSVHSSSEDLKKEH